MCKREYFVSSTQKHEAGKNEMSDKSTAASSFFSASFSCFRVRFGRIRTANESRNIEFDAVNCGYTHRIEGATGSIIIFNKQFLNENININKICVHFSLARRARNKIPKMYSSIRAIDAMLMVPHPHNLAFYRHRFVAK